MIQGGRHLQPGLGEAAARQPRRLQWSQGSSEGGAAGAHGSQEQEVAKPHSFTGDHHTRL